MSINVLLAKAEAPDDGGIAAALGATRPLYDEIMSLTEGWDQTWKHYGKKYGWKLKVHEETKMLLELTVADGWFLVSLAIREQELAALQEDPAGSALADPGGTDGAAVGRYGFKIEVRDEAACERVKTLATFLMERRGDG